MIEMYIRKKIS